MSIISKALSTVNYVRFTLRDTLKYSKGNVKGVYFPIQDDEISVISSIKPLQFISNPDFLDRLRHLNTLDFRLNCYMQDLLETVVALSINPNLRPATRPLRMLDVGSKNFYYAPALRNFLDVLDPSQQSTLTGIEIDAYRVYRDLRTRADYADYYVASLPRTSYLVGNVLEHRERYDLMTSFMPFVFSRPHLKWGLPLSTFDPLRFFEHLYDRLEVGGFILITNQGDLEYREQHRIFDALGIPYEPLGSFSSPYYVFRIPHFITLARKPK